MRPARPQGHHLGSREWALMGLLNALLAGWAAGCGVALVGVPQHVALLCGATAFCLALATHVYRA
jgi:hypothetical protein